MIDNKILGSRIKYFRKRAQLSQFDLENEIGASAGVISRIESGKVNPTKETVREVAEALEMNNRELDYLIGVTAEPATRDEIEKAKNEVKDYFNTKVFAYLIDERWRLWLVNDQFLKALGLDQDYINRVQGACTIEFMVNPDLGITKLLPDEHMEEVLRHQLCYFHREVGFMQDDPDVQKAIQSIRAHEIGGKIWDEITNQKDHDYSIREGRVVYFRIFNKFTVPLVYLYEPMLVASRFQVVVWTPANKFIKQISKFLM